MKSHTVELSTAVLIVGLLGGCATFRPNPEGKEISVTKINKQCKLLLRSKMIGVRCKI